MWAAVTSKEAWSLSASFFSNQPANKAIMLAARTKHANGRPSGGERSLVKSIVPASLSSLIQNNGSKQTRDDVESSLRLPPNPHSGVVKAATPKRAALGDAEDSKTVHSQVLKFKGWTKPKPKAKEEMCSLMRNHPRVAHSPLKCHTVPVPDPSDSSQKHREEQATAPSVCL